MHDSPPTSAGYGGSKVSNLTNSLFGYRIDDDSASDISAAAHLSVGFKFGSEPAVTSPLDDGSDSDVITTTELQAASASTTASTSSSSGNDSGSGGIATTEVMVTSASPPVIASFTPFSRLPRELQAQIWELTFEPRTIEIERDESRRLFSRTPNPVALSVSQHSRSTVS